MTKRKPKSEHRKSGRPLKYDKDFHPETVFRLALSGFTDVEIAKNLQITESTFYKWKEDHPEFSEAIREAKEDADTRVINSLFHKALGCTIKETKVFCVDGEIISETFEKEIAPDPKAAQFWLKNRKSKDWKDKHETELTGAGGGAIQIVTGVPEADLNRPPEKEEVDTMGTYEIDD